MTPDWLGSPQHFVAGAILSLTVGLIVRRRLFPTWWAAASAAIIVTMAAEALVELAEYPLLYGDSASETAYYDTIADIGLTLVGAVVGALVAVVVYRRRRR